MDTEMATSVAADTSKDTTAAADTSARTHEAAKTSTTHAASGSISRASSVASGDLEIVSESDSDEPQCAPALHAPAFVPVSAQHVPSLASASVQHAPASVSVSAPASEESRKMAARALWKHASQTKDLRLVSLAKKITINGTLEKLESPTKTSLSFLSYPTVRAERLRAFLKRATVFSMLRHKHRTPWGDLAHKTVYDAVVNHNFVLHKFSDPYEENASKLVKAQHACYRAFRDLQGSLSVASRISEVPLDVTAAFADAVLALHGADRDYSAFRLQYHRSEALCGLIISHMKLKRLTSNISNSQNVAQAKKDVNETEKVFKRLWGHKEFNKCMQTVKETCDYFVANMGRPYPVVDIPMFSLLSAPSRGDLYHATQIAISPGYFCFPWDVPEKTNKGMTLYFNALTVFYVKITKKLTDKHFEAFFTQLERLRHSLMLDVNQLMVEEVHRVFDIANKFRRMCAGEMAWPEIIAYLTRIFEHVFTRNLRNRKEVINCNWEKVKSKFNLETDVDNRKSAMALAMTNIEFAIDILLEDEKESRQVFFIHLYCKIIPPLTLILFFRFYNSARSKMSGDLVADVKKFTEDLVGAGIIKKSSLRPKLVAVMIKAKWCQDRETILNIQRGFVTPKLVAAYFVDAVFAPRLLANVQDDGIPIPEYNQISRITEAQMRGRFICASITMLNALWDEVESMRTEREKKAVQGESTSVIDREIEVAKVFYQETRKHFATLQGDRINIGDLKAAAKDAVTQAAGSEVGLIDRVFQRLLEVCIPAVDLQAPAFKVWQQRLRDFLEQAAIIPRGASTQDDLSFTPPLCRPPTSAVGSPMSFGPVQAFAAAAILPQAPSMAPRSAQAPSMAPRLAQAPSGAVRSRPGPYRPFESLLAEPRVHNVYKMVFSQDYGKIEPFEPYNDFIFDYIEHLVKLLGSISKWAVTFYAGEFEEQATKIILHMREADIKTKEAQAKKVMEPFVIARYDWLVAEAEACQTRYYLLNKTGISGPDHSFVAKGMERAVINVKLTEAKNNKDSFFQEHKGILVPEVLRRKEAEKKKMAERAVLVRAAGMTKVPLPQSQSMPAPALAQSMPTPASSQALPKTKSALDSAQADQTMAQGYPRTPAPKLQVLPQPVAAPPQHFRPMVFCPPFLFPSMAPQPVPFYAPLPRPRPIVGRKAPQVAQQSALVQPLLAQPQPALAQPQPSLAQPQPAYAQPLPAYAQPLPALAQPQPSLAQPQPSLAQPQPALAQPQTQPAPPQAKRSRGAGSSASAAGASASARPAKKSKSAVAQAGAALDPLEMLSEVCKRLAGQETGSSSASSAAGADSGTSSASSDSSASDTSSTSMDITDNGAAAGGST